VAPAWLRGAWNQPGPSSIIAESAADRREGEWKVATRALQVLVVVVLIVAAVFVAVVITQSVSSSL
jgi:hypothetical protein